MPLPTARSTINAMSTHSKTTVRLADLRIRFDLARAGLSLAHLGPAYAQLEDAPTLPAADDADGPAEQDGQTPP